MLSVLLARHNNFQPGDPAAVEMRDLFERQRFARCECAERDVALDGDLSGYDVVVLYCVTKQLGEQEEKNLCRFVEPWIAARNIPGSWICWG